MTIHRYWCKGCGDRIEVGAGGWCAAEECVSVSRIKATMVGDELHEAFTKEALLVRIDLSLKNTIVDKEHPVHAEMIGLRHRVKSYPWDDASPALWATFRAFEKKWKCPPQPDERTGLETITSHDGARHANRPSNPDRYECERCTRVGYYDYWGLMNGTSRKDFVCVCVDCAKVLSPDLPPGDARISSGTIPSWDTGWLLQRNFYTTAMITRERRARAYDGTAGAR